MILDQKTDPQQSNPSTSSTAAEPQPLQLNFQPSDSHSPPDVHSIDYTRARIEYEPPPSYFDLNRSSHSTTFTHTQVDGEQTPLLPRSESEEDQIQIRKKRSRRFYKKFFFVLILLTLVSYIFVRFTHFFVSKRGHLHVSFPLFLSHSNLYSCQSSFLLFSACSISSFRGWSSNLST